MTDLRTHMKKVHDATDVAKPIGDIHKTVEEQV